MKKIGTDAEVATIVENWHKRQRGMNLKRYSRELNISMNTLRDWIYKGARKEKTKDINI